MPKCLMIEPNQCREKGYIEFAPIPVNQYSKSVGRELALGNFTPEDLLRIQRDWPAISALSPLR